MDRRKNNNTQGGRSNGSNNNKTKATDKALADATLGVSNLQLGQTNNGAAKPKSNSGKKSSKKSTSSSNGLTTAASSPVPSKKAGPILLGVPDSPMETHDDVDPYVTKIGGVPLWLSEDLPAPSKYGVCEACGKNMYLLLQAYVPLETSPYDRVVYVWACNQRLCMRKKGSFRVVRALKLNQEYAQKLEKKAKPAAAPVAPASLVNVKIKCMQDNCNFYADPFGTAPGAFDMGNALFGGAGAGFNNPFAAPTNTVNPFAPPPGFGAPTVAAPISFASVTSSNIPAKEESFSEDEAEESIEESGPWPEKPSAFLPHYLYITEEILEDSKTISDDIAQKYSHLLALEEANQDDGEDEKGAGGANWSGEAYEKASLPKGVDKAFKKFTERVQAWPDQCVRYHFPGSPLLFSFSDPTARLLLPANASQHSKHSAPSAHRIPRCPACKGPRGFEFQLMPNLLSLLDVTSKKYLSEEETKALKERKGAQVFDIGMEWGTILVYSCVDDCFGKNTVMKKMAEEGTEEVNTRAPAVKYFEEVALIQFED
ncbi:hypothetical protein BGZ95_004785 [Linnemannia exigua]|uniref:Programmed cell death protein 2 C-terminal domain-containing protein n=1 Tax=Linnemannia exigua TaxID=604196 RepID=A0AAD4H8V6_9FUNG|nr:hypothetical protein BGZ95_004785 [Linnemannia exigua]